MDIQVEQLSNISERLLPQFILLYEESFPYEERRPTSMLLHNIRQGVTTLHAAYFGEMFLGFMTTQDLGNFVYCEYLVVEESLRGHHIGTKLLSQVLSTLTKPLVLEVEPPTDLQTRSRISFYERLDFHLCLKPYTQPSYHEIGLDALPLCLMEWGGTLLETCFDDVVRSIHQKVYGKNHA